MMDIFTSARGQAIARRLQQELERLKKQYQLV